MATRSGTKSIDLKERGAWIWKGIGRAYLLWMLGIVIGAVGLKPTSVSTSGLSLTVEHPEIIQGLVLWAAIYYAGNTFLILMTANNPLLNRAGLRLALWNSLPTGTRSLRGRTRADIEKYREAAKKFIKGITALPLILATLPIIFIVLTYPIKLASTLLSVIGIF